MTPDERIAQFRKVLQIDPNDEMAQFGLGTALLEAGRAGEAVPCFERVVAVNSRNSRAYQLLATAQRAAGQFEYAIATLTSGYRIAHKQGDLMPMKAMEQMLRELGAPVPAVAAPIGAAGSCENPFSHASPGAAPGEGGFVCRRCGSGGPRMKEQPFKGTLGEQILAGVCQNCWGEWVRMGTKVINELRLPMYEPEAQAAYDEHMKEFLGLE